MKRTVVKLCIIRKKRNAAMLSSLMSFCLASQQTNRMSSRRRPQWPYIRPLGVPIALLLLSFSLFMVNGIMNTNCGRNWERE